MYDPSLKNVKPGLTKPKAGARLQFGHPLTQDLIVACPMLEGAGQLSYNHADHRWLEFIELQKIGTLKNPWVSSPYGTGINFDTPSIALTGDDLNDFAIGYTGPARLRNYRPRFLGKPVTFIIFGKIGIPAAWKGAIDITSEDRNTAGQYSRIYCGVQHSIFGSQMWVQVADTTNIISTLIPVNGDWETLVYRLVPGVGVGFTRLPEKGRKQSQWVMSTASYGTTARSEFKIGNQYNREASWNTVMVYLYAWARYLSDEEIEKVAVAPYQFYR